MKDIMLRDNLFQDLVDFRRDFDQIFNRMLLARPDFSTESPKAFGFLPAVESYLDKSGKTFICRVSLPGIEPKDVEINTNGNLLTIRGERKFTRTSKDVDLMDEEIVYGNFERTLTLPEGVVADKLLAEYHNGILEITAPITAAALPRKVEIKVAPSSKSAAA